MKIVITPKKEKGIYAINTGKRLFSAMTHKKLIPLQKKIQTKIKLNIPPVNVKFVNVKTNKIQLPRTQLALYDSFSRYSSDCNDFYNQTEDNKKHYYSYKDIFGAEIAQKLIKKFETEKKCKYFNFSEKNEKIDKIFEMKKIRNHEHNLIHYLKDCGQNFNLHNLKRIIFQNEKKMNKTDQVCKLSYEQNENRKIMENIIKSKIEGNHRKEIISYNNNISLMGKEISDINKTLSKYPKKKKTLSIYAAQHEKIIEKYWKKYNITK